MSLDTLCRPVKMRSVALLSLLSFGLACYAHSTEVVPPSPGGAYSLHAVDQNGLPARVAYDGDSWQVVLGSLNLLPNGYFVLTESDTIWNGHAFVRDDWTEGGTWMADGSMLILDDTADTENDPYGAPTSTLIGMAALHAVVLTIPTHDGCEAHVYRYER